MIESLNTSTMPSRVCLSCGGDTFSTPVRFDEYGRIVWYLTKHPEFVVCVMCGSQVCIPTEIDNLGVFDDATD